MAVLTADVAKPAPTSHGAIVLARHGEPALSRKVRLTAAEYREFWATYEIMGILPGQTPPDRLRTFVAECGALVSSTRLRAIESAHSLAGERPFERHDLLIEAPLPPPSLPGWVKLHPSVWGFLARFWWWFFNHHEGQEKRADAEARAARAAALQGGRGAGGGDVVVLGPGGFNFMIGRSLKKLGWRLTASEGYKYWSMRRFERG